ncbi:ABC transporter ATP-binding protein [Tabrizicola oligotrophica]|uniref:ABC transporter ATP-binding protein n=1 Tax=Tabrizicola oligotrophica TaxID=2710650 RepID=A0A6M0QXW9_9RHOB|nr:ABC transporter ATP-binding protein [Tabrizicola oligotrophica]NEY91811.1 ABC transporter ATP-binding protein [Tabrizicola oligotrophica]
MAEITFDNVSKRFGATVAVNAASFTVRDNEFFCFFGPPLSGKTTLLRLILGLEVPDEGRILIDGKDVTRTGPAARNIAMVFQNLALFPHMTARDNVRFPLVERGVPAAQITARLEEVAAKLHIGHILHKHPGQLSGGERQRVAIARALVRDPAAYLMDDPISALDARLREEARVELKRMQREAGRTLIYVTHDQEEAMSVADRMAILEQGVIRQIGTPAELYDRPATSYVAQLLGAPVMNLIPPGLFATRPGAALVGVRPEDLRVTPDPAGRAEVTGVEPLGGYTVLTLRAGESQLRVLLRGQPAFAPGQRLHLDAAEERLHHFAADGHRLAG